jgi:hypothetical protein
MKRPRQSIAAILVAAACLAACGGGGGSSGNPPAPPPSSEIRNVTVDLSRYITESVRYVQAFSEGYVVPTAAELTQFDTVIAHILDQDFEAAAAAADSLDYDVLRITDTGDANNRLYCLQEVELRGRGFFCIDTDSTAAHHISVPHPLYDIGTHIESIHVMRETGARFLSVSTSHRCASSSNSSCSGTTTACGAAGPYKVSDAAHNVDAFFYRFGVAVHDRSAATQTLQLHGCGSSTCPSNYDGDDIVARLSAGTTLDLPGDELVNRLNTALNAEIAAAAMGTALSCSEPGDDKQLCGTTNTLGRYINGQADSCQNAATSFENSRWLHIEQNRNLRQDDGAGDEITPLSLSNAINAVVMFPLRRQ